MFIDCECSCKLYWQYCKSEITMYFDVRNFNVMYDKFSMCVDYECAYRLCMKILYIVCRHQKCIPQSHCHIKFHLNAQFV
jgi:hypothetical protein